jgi:hypothetical protein
MVLPLKAKTLIKNAFERYLSFFAFGVIVIVFMILLKRVEVAVFKLSPFILTLVLFLSNVILQTFLVLVIPIIVIKKKSLFKALGSSIVLGFRNFLSVFILIFLPFLVYLPITLLKTATPKLIDKTFPEISLYIAVAGIFLAAFAECFIMVCASQFLLDKDTSHKVASHK